MPLIKRTIEERVRSKVRQSKAVLIFGPRRVGKTVLLKNIVDTWTAGPTMLLNGEDSSVRELLEERTIANYRGLFGSTTLLAIDEAQNIPDIGRVLKLIVDEVPGVAVIASGSSSFDLLKRAGEPLVGRATQFMLMPFAQTEISQIENPVETRCALHSRLVYGAYPDVVLSSDFEEKAEYLRDMVNAYLLKDILMVDGVKNSAKMHQLLKLIALQVGSEVSIDELGRQLAMSKNTVERYLDLLSKVFVIYRLGGFSRNLRNEVTRSGKWYFYDNGIRNAVIGNFQPLTSRTDVGMLWENYMISERLKLNNNLGWHNRYYFWRTYAQNEVDLIEERESGSLSAYEFKWGNKHPAVPAAFAKGYPDATFTVVSRQNYLTDFILPG